MHLSLSNVDPNARGRWLKQRGSFDRAAVIHKVYLVRVTECNKGNSPFETLLDKYYLGGEMGKENSHVVVRICVRDLNVVSLIR